jgi:Uma2 family endonuclease
MRQHRGEAFDGTTTFIFPNGVKRCPDTAWVSSERLLALPYKARRKRLRVTPEFVIEIKSPTDKYPELQAKMDDYIENGIELGWLIHTDLREVKTYTKIEISTFKDLAKIRGTGPVKSFTLDLRPIWQGLRDGGE